MVCETPENFLPNAHTLQTYFNGLAQHRGRFAPQYADAHHGGPSQQQTDLCHRLFRLRQFTQQDVLLSCGALTFDTRSRTAAVNGQTLTLTRKETGILEYLMVHQGRPVSQEELMDHVWDNSVDSFSNSIRVHISALRKKLRAALGYDPIRNRIGEGYLMGGEEA